MYFFVDESGNTGNNLFDEAQPVLSYGVLSSVTNPDALSKKIHGQMLNRLNVDQLHANALGEHGLAKIGDLLFEHQKKLKFDFDYYFVKKKDFAIVTFFDRVFDNVLNPAVPWNWYQTPLKYLIVLTLPTIFDDDLLRRAWSCATSLDESRAIGELTSTLEELLRRAYSGLSDPRAREVITDAFSWAANHPKDLQYTVSSKWQVLYASPNVVGFQFVLAAIARKLRAKKKRSPRSIVVDQQNQFNKIQSDLQSHYSAISEGAKASPFSNRKFLDVDLNEEFANMPKEKFDVSASVDSIGLQICDVYLWLFNRLLNHGNLDDQLKPVVSLLLKRSLTDGISLEAINSRFGRFEAQLPSLEDTDMGAAKRVYNEIEVARRESMARHAGIEDHV